MSLREYFASTSGLGVLSTADDDGQVNAAIYGRPHITDSGELVFVMTDRQTRHNLIENPRASYLFKAEGPGYQGKRLLLRQIRQSEEDPLLETLAQSTGLPDVCERLGTLCVAYFRVEGEKPLVA